MIHVEHLSTVSGMIIKALVLYLYQIKNKDMTEPLRGQLVEINLQRT